MEKVRSIVEKMEGEVKKLREDIKERKDEIGKINKEIEEKGDKDQLRIQKVIEELKVGIGSNKSRIESVSEELHRLTERRKQLKKTHDDLK